jgi:hypothetical protein
MWLRVGGSAGHAHTYGLTIDEGVVGKDFDKRKWEVTVETSKEVREDAEKAKAAQKEASLEVFMDKVKKALEGCPQGETLTNLHNTHSLSKPKLGQALAALCARGEVAKTQFWKSSGQGWRLVDGWRLITPEDRAMTPEQWARVYKGEIIGVVRGLPPPARPGAG